MKERDNDGGEVIDCMRWGDEDEKAHDTAILRHLLLSIVEVLALFGLFRSSRIILAWVSLAFGCVLLFYEHNRAHSPFIQEFSTILLACCASQTAVASCWPCFTASGLAQVRGLFSTVEWPSDAA